MTLPSSEARSLPHREQADLLIQHAAVLGEALGVPPNEMARAALSLVVVLAQKSPDPDGALAKLVQAVGATK